MEPPDLWSRFRVEEQRHQAGLAHQARVRERFEPLWDWAQLLTSAILIVFFTWIVLRLEAASPLGVAGLVGVVSATLATVTALASVLPSLRVTRALRLVGRAAWSISLTVLVCLPFILFLSFFLAFW